MPPKTRKKTTRSTDKIVKAGIFNTELFYPRIVLLTIWKLPNSEQSYKGKVKTHKYIKQTKSVNNRKTVKTVMTMNRLTGREKDDSEHRQNCQSWYI
jgi:hypothetical protein